MFLVLSGSERVALTDAAVRERRMRQWRRYQAVLLVADGKPPHEVAASVGCSRASVKWLIRHQSKPTPRRLRRF